MTKTAPDSAKTPKAGAKPKLQFLLHDPTDSVGVAVVDIKKGSMVQGRSLAGGGMVKVKALSEIPLGHKIALKNFAVNETVMKYGVDIGKIVAPIKRGEHVHVHNLKTKRW